MQANFFFSAVDKLPNLRFENFTNTDEFTLNATLTTTRNCKISESQMLLGNSHYLQFKTAKKDYILHIISFCPIFYAFIA